MRSHHRLNVAPAFFRRQHPHSLLRKPLNPLATTFATASTTLRSGANIMDAERLLLRISDTVTATVGAPIPRTAEQITSTTGGGTPSALRLTELSRILPNIEPESQRRVLEIGERFVRFVDRAYPELVSVSARKDKAPSKTVCMVSGERN
jgi:hypothetical protein